MASKWNNFFLQGLSGLGQVGYNTIKTLIDTYQAEVDRDYAEYFPNLTLIDNGTIENQCVRLYHKETPDKVFRFLNGPQPRSDELISMLLQKFIRDISELHKNQKIDLYLSFGAYVTKTLSHVELQEQSFSTKEELADHILKSEIEKKRNLYIATSGNLAYDDFIKELKGEDAIVKESGGYIIGLNGVLPAMVGERLKIPTATIMIETTGIGPDIRSSNDFPVLAQFLGLLATKRALTFLEKTFDLEDHLGSKVDSIIEELKSSARQEIINFFDRDNGPDMGREFDYRNDKMYT